MDESANNLIEITSLETQLSIKREEYLRAIKNGVVLDELKKIFLEVKSLEQKLNLAKYAILEMQKNRLS